MQRILLLSAILIFTQAATSSAQSEAQPEAAASTEAIYACAALPEDAARLACYDEAVGRLQAAEQAGEVTTITKAEIEDVQREAFGFNLPTLPRLTLPKFGRSATAEEVQNGELDSIRLAVTKVSVSKINGLRITLENGQIWQQTDSRTVYYSKKRGVREAEIKRAAMGSFMMKLDDGRAFRVRRLK